MADGARKILHGIGAAVFDLDGTLFDSTRLWYDIDERFLGARGLRPTAEYQRDIAALGNLAAAAYTVKYYGLNETPEALAAEWSDMARKEYAERIPLLRGAREYLELTKAAGVTVLAATSLARELAEPCLKNNGIFDLFDGILTADEAGFGKNTPDIYLYACRLAGVEPRHAVAFDDIPTAIGSAKRAGLVTVSVVSIKTERGRTDAADYIVADLSQAPLLSRE